MRKEAIDELLEKAADYISENKVRMDVINRIGGRIGSTAGINGWELYSEHAEDYVSYTFQDMLQNLGNMVIAMLVKSKGENLTLRFKLHRDEGETDKFTTKLYTGVVEIVRPERIYVPIQPRVLPDDYQLTPPYVRARDSKLPRDYLYCEWCGGYTRSERGTGACAACGHIRTHRSFKEEEA